MSRLHSADTSAPTAWRNQLASRQRRAAAWWAGRTARERRLLSLGTLLLALTVLWTLGLKPAINSITGSQQQLSRLHAEAAQLDALVLEAQALQRSQSGRIEAAAMPQALQTTLRRAGLETSATLVSTGLPPPSLAPEWEVLISDASAAHLMEWLADLPSVLHVSVSTVELSRSQLDGRDRPGQVSGRILLRGHKEPLP